MLRVMRVGIVRIQGLDHIALRLGNKDLILAQHRFKFLAGQDRIEQILPFISSAKIASVMNKPDIIAVQMLPCPVNTRKFTVSRILDGDIISLITVNIYIIYSNNSFGYCIYDI